MAKPLLIQGAMDDELSILLKATESLEEKTYGSWTFWQGIINGKSVVISRTGIGLANAAASSAIGINMYSPSVIINQGTAGAHDEALNTGDIVLGKKSFNFGAFMTNFASTGIFPKEWESFKDVMILRENGKQVENSHGFEADSKLLQKALSAAGDYKSGKVVQGVIGSADEWNNELERISWIRERYSTSVEDMETASAALVAKAFSIPFLGIRVVSNSIVKGQALNYKMAEACQNFIIRLIKDL